MIGCEFTNASGFARERVVFLTGMQIMIDGDKLLYDVSWDAKGETSKKKQGEPMGSIGKLHKAMHDSEFRIHLDRGGLFMTLARCLDIRWIIWFIRVDWRQRNEIYSKLCILQRAFRHRVMRRRLSNDRIFSKAAAVQRHLTHKLKGNCDVITMIIQHYLLAVNNNSSSAANKGVESRRLLRPNGPVQWIKPHGDGQILLNI